ncbi:hypothetical protein ScalyP_jg10983 [Parmales sp. scaly parma]|nr:hypothetical protein ScalyP_jg10983 [Parmales sp. scaly parma]
MEDPDAYSELDSTIQGLYSNEKNAFHLILQKLQKHSKIQAKTLKRLYKLEEQHEQDTLEIAELKKEVQCLSYNLSPDSFAEPVEEKAVAVAVAVTPTPTPVLATPTTLENVPLLKEQIDDDEAAEPPFVAAPAPVSTPTKAPPPNNKQEALLVAPIAPLSPAPSSPKSNQKRRSTVNVSKNKLDVAMTMTRRLDQLEAGQVGF